MIKHALITASIALSGCNTLQPAPMPKYTVSLTIYVRDEAKLCEHAWAIALPRHGIRVTEALTMRGSTFDTARCLSVVFQMVDAPELVSAGIEVREVLP